MGLPPNPPSRKSIVSQPGNSITRGRLSILSCSSGRPFADKVADHLREAFSNPGARSSYCLRESTEILFANGEIKTVIDENIRGDDTYVIQCTDDPLRRAHADPSQRRSVNDNLLALLTAINAAYQSDAESITAVIPQFCYSRQERKKTRECITARLIAGMLEDAGANRVLTLDIHAEAIQGFFKHAILEDLHASKDIMRFFRSSVPLENVVVVAPDTGSADKARHYAQKLGCRFAVVDKARDYTKASTIESMRLVGDVADCRVIMPDDLVATGGTLINACRLLKDKGATEVFVACSLPYFNGDAIEKLSKAHSEGLFEMVVGTDAVHHGPEFIAKHHWYREVSLAPLFAKVIYSINQKRSVSELLK